MDCLDYEFPSHNLVVYTTDGLPAIPSKPAALNMNDRGHKADTLILKDLETLDKMAKIIDNLVATVEMKCDPFCSELLSWCIYPTKLFQSDPIPNHLNVFCAPEEETKVVFL
jgi:hypothetical protein